ncbi:acyltransferase [Pseudomonas sp. C2B4]|uniref:acyltransferase family protein n=1 Tax=Pseudomonas sp. C2B4 TaxID=2735270 RepID=UPI001586692A|nr:acyltransferase [Pseudomonas sp. C2B4]NUU35664.1 acyltransferase [Pseudomonas sp. C2B4]
MQQVRANLESFSNITLLRAVASLMVVYDHLFSMVPVKNFGSPAFPVSFVQTAIDNPLGIIQDFGWIGVAIFFIVSGFIITHVSMRESQTEFLVKRIFRIYPPLILAVLIACAMTYITTNQTFSFWEIISAFTLTNYWTYPQIVILGVAWTLAIEIIFYAFTFVLLPILKNNPCAAIIIQVAVVFCVYAVRGKFGNEFFLFAACVAYLPYLIVGQVTYFLYSKVIGLKVFFALLILLYAAILAGIQLIHVIFLPANNSYLINFSYAYFIFIMLLVFKDRVKVPQFVHRLADSSYSIYLLHGTIGGAVIVLVAKYTSNHSAPVIFITSLAAAALSILVAWIFFLLVEKPSIKVARSLCKMINARTLKVQKEQA